MADVFTLKNPSLLAWLVAVLVASVAVGVLLPPAFWLCGVGAALVVVGSIANSARTDQWWSWQLKGSLNWFEGWAASTGAILTVVPLLLALIRLGLS
jgi:hypothetical protein